MSGQQDTLAAATQLQIIAREKLHAPLEIECLPLTRYSLSFVGEGEQLKVTSASGSSQWVKWLML